MNFYQFALANPVLAVILSIVFGVTLYGIVELIVRRNKLEDE